ncbi:MAG TPA: tryptophan--tRNA ligase [Dehalococcoidia bacterium]|nr:tryptophan--tRNA ligase [Dehalococcoidia bacterium]MDP6272544.1 tryptophan--tRNA ligase [Dehalococcoidia bacterium]MDP7159674.1 tryptophan--tRNA ligase [Dehalococcoidia bacterium]MDP7212866.1 tryptophan--tRNA ligase [Dehalococcoidia bacterium]MDP7514679.1 tryptophan--tRNA ligase [Dehalococcoidia bacterium]
MVKLFGPETNMAADMADNTGRKRILTGIRPTGRLHIGHYVGALENWVRLQHGYDAYFLIADYQALGDHIDDIQLIRESVLQVAIDWLSVGLDPEESTFVIQSYVPEHAELTMLLSFITPLGMLQRNPTLKAETEQLRPEQLNVGFFNYPMSQVADILLPRADLVPVGEDQAPHIEMTREIARKFNRLFARENPVFLEPGTLIGRIPRLSGTDGQAKMSKSRGNAIELGDDEETVRKKVMSMFTDPTRLRATDPGHVEGNPVFEYHDAFNPDTAEVDEFKERYRAGTVGDVDVKKALIVAMNNFLDPIRQKRAYYEDHMSEVEEALMEGTRRARVTAAETMKAVRDAMQINTYTSTWE